jgi:hypothetical protein
MPSKTLIRSKKKHEVKLSEDGHLAQSAQLHGQALELPVPESIRKGAGSKRANVADSPLPPVGRARTSTGRGKAKLVGEQATTAKVAKVAKPPKATAPRRPSADKAPLSPRLPAFVPADGLWEEDSAVMLRLQALIQRNAQLSEQLQRIQNHPAPKGREP